MKIKTSRVGVCILVGVLALIFVGILNTQNIVPARAEAPLELEFYTFPKIQSKEIRAEKVYANRIYIYGYDLFSLNESLLNLLLSKDIISKEEGQSILDKAKTVIKPKPNHQLNTKRE